MFDYFEGHCGFECRLRSTGINPSVMLYMKFLGILVHDKRAFKGFTTPGHCDLEWGSRLTRLKLGRASCPNALLM